MTDELDKNDPLDSTMDGEIGRILDGYLAARENGEDISRDDLLAQHPAYADRLAECLDGIDLLDSRLTSPEDPLATFADFEIRGELGRGGMGVVYEAYQKSLDRIVALKVMRFGVVDPRALERFQREAETAGGLHHTNIVPVYATGREGDTSWYAMQRIEGQSLAQRIEAAYRSDAPANVPVEEVVRIGLQAAEALDYAHQRDVIHRDVKPANLIIDQEDCVWLTDFGLARRLVDVGATMTGALMGTPRYMSPEQADVTRVDVDHHSDIYSLGATLYELATGHPPFEGDDPLQVITQIRETDPRSPRSLRTDIPRDLEVVLLKCLAKEPHRRYASAGALADDLRAIAEDRPIKARAMSVFERAVRWSRKHRTVARSMAIAVLFTTAALICGFFAVTAWQRSLLGQFRMRAGDGPYTADIRRIDEDGPELTPTTITVPMQERQTLAKGDYEMQLGIRGRWSETIRFPIGSGAPSELKFRTDQTVTREISIANSQAVVVADDDDDPNPPRVLRFRDTELSSFGADPENDWTLTCNQIECEQTKLERTTSSEEGSEDAREVVTIDFGYARNSKFPWAESTLNSRPRRATPIRAVKTPIDLDGDGENDTLVAAIYDSALMAVDAKGKLLWARHYQFGAVATNGPQRNGRSPEGRRFVLDITPISDQNGDGIDELVAQIVRIRPGAANDVCIAIICGENGGCVSVVSTIAISPTPSPGLTSCPWPERGILQPNTLRQRHSSVYFARNGVRRTRSSELNSVFWSRGNAGSTYALPLPLVVRERGGKTIAVQSVGPDFHCYDLGAQKRVAAKTHRGNTLPLCGPRLVNLAGTSPALAIVFVFEHRIVAYRPTGEILWECQTRRLAQGLGGPYVNTAKFEFNSSDTFRPLWPLLSDLDDDGTDEMLMSPGDSNHTGVWMFETKTGRTVWDEYAMQYASFADRQINRLVVTSDIDGDGWRDIATASFSGRADSITSERWLKGTVFVYVDWLSGKTGGKLTWARHPVRFALSNLKVLELDAIRAGEVDGKSVIEVELLVGDSHAEHELEASTLRFSPDQRYATSIAQGLTVCTDSARVANRARWYRQRSGAYSLDEEKLVLLPEADAATRSLGEHMPIANWIASDGTPRIALLGDEPFRVAVHDLDRTRTVWTTDASELGQSVLPISRGGTVDLLVQFQTFDGRRNVRQIELRSGESGRVIWHCGEEIGERMIHAQSVPMADGTTRTIVVCRGSRNTTKNDGLVMTMLSAKGHVLWSREILRKASVVNSPTELPDYGLVDVNGDSFPDIVGPDTTTGGVLMMTVRDGTTGEPIWNRLWDRQGYRTDYVPNPWSIVSVDGKASLAILEQEQRDDDKHLATIVVCDAANGSVLYTHESDLRTADPEYVSLVNCSPSADDNRIGVWLRDKKFRPVWMEFKVMQDRLGLVQESMVNGLARGASVWATDVDGDGLAEPFASENGELLRFSRSTGEAVWRTELNTPDHYRRFEISNGSIATWLDGQHRTNVHWIDPGSGQPIHQVSIVNFSKSARYPDGAKPLSVTASDSNSRYFVVPTNDGVRLSKITANDVGEIRLPGRGHSDDPRWEVRPQIGVVVGHDSLWEALRQGLVSVSFVTFGVVIPIAYLRKLIRDRRWSLRFFLVAPVVVCVLVAAWQSGAVTTKPDEMMLVLLIGVSWLFAGYGAWYAIRRWQAMRWLFPLLVAVIFALLIGYYWRKESLGGSFRYIIGFNEIGSALATALLQVGGLCGWAMVLSRIASWLGTRFKSTQSTLVKAP